MLRLNLTRAIRVALGWGRKGATFPRWLSTLTFPNQLGAAGSIGVFNNGEKNEKILKVAILPEWLSGEGNSAEMQFIVAELVASGGSPSSTSKKSTSQKLTNRK